MEVRSQSYLSFYNRKSGRVQADIWAELAGGLWRSFSIDNFLYNERLGGRRQTEYRPLFEGVEVIYPGFYWDEECDALAESRYYPPILEHVSRTTLRQALEAYFAPYRGRRIGVHLSGGLDSSLIMAWLRELDIPFVAVGMQSSRWEFRTERRVQEAVGVWAEEVVLVDMEVGDFVRDDLFLAEQYPDAMINTSQSTAILVEEFRRLGVEVVFSGQGGDSLLADAVPANGAGEGFNIDNEFVVPAEIDYYGAYGLTMAYPYADRGIIDQLTNLRRGEREDVPKYWARTYFRDILPRELSEYCYAADFMGHYIQRLEQLRSVAPALMREARELLPHTAFSEEAIRAMCAYSLLNLETQSYFEFTAPLRVAIWLRGLRRAGIIKQ